MTEIDTNNGVVPIIDSEYNVDKNYTYGFKNLHLAVVTKVSADGEYTYRKPFRLQGAIDFGSTPITTDLTEYADDTTYYAEELVTGQDITITLFDVPMEVQTQVYGSKLVDGVLIENVNSTVKEVAIMFEVTGKETHLRYNYYRVKLGRPERNTQTKGDSTELNRYTLSGTAMPLDDGTLVATAFEGSKHYDNWFEQVVTLKEIEDTE